MVSVKELETAPLNPDLFHTRRLKDIYKGLLSGKENAQQQLVDLIGDPQYNHNSLRNYGDVVYTDETRQALQLLPMIATQKSIPVIEKILRTGSKGKTLQVMISGAAYAASEIDSPQVAKLIPLINQNLAKLEIGNSEWMDDDALEFRIPRNGAINTLDEARTAVLWKTAGRVRNSLAVILPFTRRGQSFLTLHVDPETRSIICFDLEGPLSGLDCAYEVFKLVSDGEQMFRVISYYDDMVCGLIPGRREWRRENYEAGDTLKLIIPQLIHHGISENDIRDVSSKASLVPGVKELFGELENEGWRRNIVSTSYSQHAYNIGGQLGLAPKDIYCTQMPLDRMQGSYSRDAATLLNEFERKLKGFSPNDFGTAKDLELKAVLDKFYWEELPRTKLGEITEGVTVMGGARKAWAVERVARDANAFIEQMAFVGDSITDSQAAKVVEATRGLMTAFNGNDFVIPFATIGFGTVNMNHLKPALDVWRGNGRAGLREWVNSYPNPQEEFDTNFDWIVDATDEKVQEIVVTHRKFRRKLRDDAASLG